jgi:hypothetical protein
MERHYSTQTVSIGIFLLLLSVVTYAGCQSKTDQNAGNATDTQKNMQSTVTNNYITEYPVYKTNTEKELAANRDTINIFRERLKKAGAKMKEALDSTEQALEKENAVLERKLESFKAEGQDTWMQFKEQFDRSMDSIRENFKDLTHKYYQIKAED